MKSELYGYQKHLLRNNNNTENVQFDILKQQNCIKTLNIPT